MRYLLPMLFVASAIAINVIVWLNEWMSGKYIRFALDIGGTLLIATLGGNGYMMLGSSLFASLIWSWYLNFKWKFKDFDEWSKEKKVIMIILGVVVATLILKAYTPII